MGREISITVLSGVSAGDVFKQDIGSSPYVIGRQPGCDMVLHDPTVSRKHAQLVLRDDGPYLEDLGSSHGTVHMGFTVQGGSENARKLTPGDEFKIGEALFRVQFEQPRSEVIAEEGEDGSTGGLSPSKKKLFVVVGVLLAVLLVLLLLPGKKKKTVPKQLSNAPLVMPQNRVIGYWTRSRSKLYRDNRHIDKATFSLLPSDQLVEFDYISGAAIAVYVDGTKIALLPPSPGSWEHGAIVVRDVVGGTDRQLVFDNLDYPRNQPGDGPYKQWGVYKVRSRLLTRDEEVVDVGKVLDSTIGLTGTIDKSPGSLYRVTLQYYRLILELISELKLPAAYVSINPEMRFPIESDLKRDLESIARERLENLSTERLNSHLAAITRLTAALDTEVWRRIDSRIHKVNFAKDIENYLDAYDHLKAIQRIVPDKYDERFKKAERLLDDTEVIPEKLRRDPRRYRKKMRRR